MPKAEGKFEQEDTEAPKTALVPLAQEEVRQMVLGGVSGISREITENILSAADIDAMLGGTEPTSALVGVTFALKAWKWLRSQIKGGAGVFAVLEVLTLSGDTKVVTTGSQNILAALLWFEDHGVSDPPALTVRESITGDGNTVYRLAKAPGA